jgi:DUF4097 and DUF4098 domain-containing protein YvlB/uncharacterized membrane protein HdeD (DUF308 family)
MLKRIATLLLGIGLIGLGVLFFVAPERAFAVQILTRFWPVFLILAGVVRVAGYLIDRHPRSPIGGMMLAAIGGILLSANLLSHNSFLLILGKYWFWLLLAFIIGRVLKQYTHRIEDGIRTNAFAPGAVIVMILITGSGLAANFLTRSGQTGFNLKIGRFGGVSDYFFGNQFQVEDDLPQTFAIAPNARLIINNANGDVEVNSAPHSQATARLIKRIRAASEEDAKAAAKNIHLQIASDGNSSQFNVATAGDQQDFAVSIIITVPQNSAASVEITNSMGAVKLAGLRGDHTIRNCERAEVGNNIGRVMIENPRGSVEISQLQGEVNLVNTRRDVALRAITGPITIDARGGALNLEESAGPIRLRAVDARIEINEIGNDSLINQRVINIEEARNSRIKIQEVKGGVEISADRSRIEAEAITGDFTVTSSTERVVANRISGALRIKAGEGAVEIEEIKGPATIEAARDVTIRNFRGPLNVTSRQGAINLETSEKLAADIKAVNDRGKIRISIPEDAGFRLDANAGKGRVRVRGFDSLVMARDDRSYAMGYNISDSSPSVILRSSGGEIQLQSSGLALAGNDE